MAINLEGELDGDEQAAKPMPLIRLKDEYLEQEDGVRFLMADELGNSVACKVSHEALRAQAERVHFSGTDSAVFQTFRELIEVRVTLLMLRDHSIIMAECLLALKRSRGSRAAPSWVLISANILVGNQPASRTGRRYQRCPSNGPPNPPPFCDIHL